MAKISPNARKAAMPGVDQAWQTHQDVNHLAEAQAIKKDPARMKNVKVHIKNLVQATGTNGKRKKRI
jgi:hypothetical protein